MVNWYQSEIVLTGKQPVFLALIAFVITLFATRFIVRMIRAGKGPFRNVDTGDVHIHHVIPGIVLMGIGGLVGLSASGAGILKDFAGILFGMGCALVLDEFALILHLEDVYWEKEGRLSVQATSIAIVVMLAAVLVAAPNRNEVPEQLPDGISHNVYSLITTVLFIIFWVMPVAVCLLKGKVFTAAIAVLGFGIIFAWVGSVRVGKPGSPWARSKYAEDSKKMAKAKKRKEAEERRTAPIMRVWEKGVFGFDGTEKSIKEGGRYAQQAEQQTPAGQTATMTATATDDDKPTSK